MSYFEQRGVCVWRGGAGRGGSPEAVLDNVRQRVKDGKMILTFFQAMATRGDTADIGFWNVGQGGRAGAKAGGTLSRTIFLVSAPGAEAAAG